MKEPYPAKHRSASGPVVGTHYIRLDEETDTKIREIQAETKRVFRAMGYEEHDPTRVATISMLIKKGITAHKQNPVRLV